MSTIRQRGDAWQAIVRVRKDGKTFNQSKTFPTERLAKDWARRLEDNIDAQGIPQRQLSTATFGELMLKYKKTVNEVKPMRRQLIWEIDMLADMPIGKLKLNALTAAEFTKFARNRQAAGAGPATVLHNLSTMRSVLSAAKPMFDLQVKTDQIAEAIAALKRVGVVADSESRDRRPTANELDTLRREFKRIAAHPSTTINMADFIDIAVWFPRRREELCTMRWEDYDGRKVILRDTKHPTKMRNEVVPVPREAAAIIDRQPRVSEYILPYKPDSVSAAFQRACDRLGIEDLRLHDLRHEGISRLFERGLAIQEVALISGHTSWAQLKRYTQLTPEHVLNMLDRK